MLGHGLISWLPAWLVLRVIVGLGMMCQYMVIESWLNEQAAAKQRGMVFSGYMIASYLGLVLGQLVLVVHPQLGPELLMLVALCFALCLVPVAMTRAIHPAPLHPAPLEPRFFMKRVPQSLTAVLGAGLIIGSFYGLAPVYAAEQGLSTEQVGLFMGCCILAGFLVQWPLGLLSDRYDRSVLMRIFAAALVVASLPLALFPSVPVEVLFGVGFSGLVDAVLSLSAGRGIRQRPRRGRAPGVADGHAAHDLRHRCEYRPAGGWRDHESLWRPHAVCVRLWRGCHPRAADQAQSGHSPAPGRERATASRCDAGQYVQLATGGCTRPRVDEQVVQDQMQTTVEPEPEPETVAEAEAEPVASTQVVEEDERERESETWKA